MSSKEFRTTQEQFPHIRTISIVFKRPYTRGRDSTSINRAKYEAQLKFQKNMEFYSTNNYFLVINIFS